MRGADNAVMSRVKLTVGRGTIKVSESVTQWLILALAGSVHNLRWLTLIALGSVPSRLLSGAVTPGFELTPQGAEEKTWESAMRNLSS